MVKWLFNVQITPLKLFAFTSEMHVMIVKIRITKIYHNHTTKQLQKEITLC